MEKKEQQIRVLNTFLADPLQGRLGLHSLRLIPTFSKFCSFCEEQGYLNIGLLLGRFACFILIYLFMHVCYYGDQTFMC